VKGTGGGGGQRNWFPVCHCGRKCWLKTPTVSTKFGGARPPRLPSSLPLALWSREDGDNHGFRQWIWAEMCVSCRFFCIEHASSFGTAGDAVVVVDLQRNKAKKKKKRPCVVKKLAPNGSELLTDLNCCSMHWESSLVYSCWCSFEIRL
jgi:hypothetical protein